MGVDKARYEPGSVVLVLTTAPDEDTLLRIGRTLIEERLAACVNLVPGVRSVYRWQGEIEDAREVLGLIKTTRGRLEALERRLTSLHPYDTPEVLVVPVHGGLQAYLEWISGAVDPPSE